MFRPRVIPCLLLKNTGLIKTVQFKNGKYIGDPINAVKIFNDKGADELVVLDIMATIEERGPNFSLIRQIANEAFMPVGYGGGIRTIDDVKKILSIGIEKVIVNSYAMENPSFITDASNIAGSQSVVVSIDVKKNLFGNYKVVTYGARNKTDINPVEFAKQMEVAGAGEIMLNSVDRDGIMKGYDLDLINKVSKSVKIPVIACGGAGNLQDFSDAIEKGYASAVAAGSMFVFYGKHKAVLITYPREDELKELFKGNK